MEPLKVTCAMSPAAMSVAQLGSKGKTNFWNASVMASFSSVPHLILCAKTKLAPTLPWRCR